MDNLEHRLKCIENLLIVAIDRIDELEAQNKELDTRTSGLQIIGMTTNKYEDDPCIMTMNISSFKRS